MGKSVIAEVFTASWPPQGAVCVFSTSPLGTGWINLKWAFAHEKKMKRTKKVAKVFVVFMLKEFWM